MLFPQLFSPTRIGHLDLKNRIVMAPIGLGFFDHGFVTQRVRNFYRKRADGGVGLIITTAMTVNKPINTQAAYNMVHPNLSDDKFIPGWKEVTDQIHEFDVKVGAQLSHCGRQISNEQWGEEPVSSSAIPCPVCRSKPRALSVMEIDEIITMFVEAAERCKKAGMDLIEIHGAHGYLGTQFLSPYMNHRTDEYGGDAEGRTRFVREMIRRIKSSLGQEFIVGVRINGQDNIKGGATLEDAMEIARYLERDGADFLHVSATVYGGYPPISPMAEPPGCYVHLAEAIKGEVNIPVIAVGKIDTPQLAEEILKENKADLVAVGRALIADPEWPKKAAMGRPEAIRKCIYCNQGCLDRVNDINLENKMTSITCLVNPEVGKEEEVRIRPARKRKRVAVVGGGPAGLEAARVAAARGHEVILFEKEARLGGQFLLASLIPTKGHYKEAIEYLAKAIQALGVEIRLGVESNTQSVLALDPQVVVIASGAIPSVPKIPGAEMDYVATYDRVLLGQFDAGEKVLVVGGGSVGLETADFLSSQGKKVHVIEMDNRFARDMGKVAWFGLRRRLSEKEVALTKSSKVIRILDHKVEVLQNNEKILLNGYDTMVLAVGSQPIENLSKDLQNRIQEVHVIGDALTPRNALEAIHEGAMVGRKV